MYRYICVFVSDLIKPLFWFYNFRTLRGGARDKAKYIVKSMTDS